MQREHQFYAFDSAGTLVWAGVHGLGRVTARAVRKRQRKWMAWRRRYLETHPGDYPLRHAIEQLGVVPACKGRVTTVVVFPVCHPEQSRRIRVA